MWRHGWEAIFLFPGGDYKVECSSFKVLGEESSVMLISGDFKHKRTENNALFSPQDLSTGKLFKKKFWVDRVFSSYKIKLVFINQRQLQLQISSSLSNGFTKNISKKKILCLLLRFYTAVCNNLFYIHCCKNRLQLQKITFRFFNNKKIFLLLHFSYSHCCVFHPVLPSHYNGQLITNYITYATIKKTYIHLLCHASVT